MRRVLALAALLALAGCASQPEERYAWGAYEGLLYLSLTGRGAVDLQAMIDTMERDRETAASAGKPLPPGWLAHLGYLYAETGRLDLAAAAFEQEKAAYPEATVFMDRLLAGLTGAPVAGAESDAEGEE